MIMKKLLDGIKASGLTKLAYLGVGVAGFVLGSQVVGVAGLAIFGYINANTIYKKVMEIKF